MTAREATEDVDEQPHRRIAGEVGHQQVEVVRGEIVVCPPGVAALDDRIQFAVEEATAPACGRRRRDGQSQNAHN